MSEGPRVGDYRVDVSSLVLVAVPAMTDPDARLLVVDEIGLMELTSPVFREAVLMLLDDPRPVLGTIRYRREPFCDRLKGHVGTEVIEVTPENRDELVEMLAIRLIDEVIPQ
jgi:nucleoside-triphosphatase